MKLSHEEQILILRNHFEKKGYRVHSGLQFGCELVLYADSPDLVHSDFCVKLVSPQWKDCLDWRCLQALCRSMPDLHKTLVICRVLDQCKCKHRKEDTNSGNEGTLGQVCLLSDCYSIEEIAVASEHAPFRYRKKKKDVGEQVKPRKEKRMKI